MTSETDLPAGVRKVVEGVPYCPNCDIPMKPIASVDTTERPKTGINAAMTLEDVARVCADLEHDAEELANEVERAKKVYGDKKKAYDAKIVTLRLAVERLGRVLGGEQIQVDLPLLDVAEQEPEPDLGLTADDAMEGVLEANAIILRERLANLLIVVDVAEIAAWSLENYDAVCRYIDLLEAGHDASQFTSDAPRPACLPVDVPDHITALHASLSRLGIVIGLGAICAWTSEQRSQAAEWAAMEADSPDSAERPEHVPAPAGEAPPPPKRRGRKQQDPVHA